MNAGDEGNAGFVVAASPARFLARASSLMALVSSPRPVATAFAMAIAAVLGLCPPGQAQAPSKSDSSGAPSLAVTRSPTLVAVGVGSLVEAVTISSHKQIQYFGLGHFVQRDWQSGLAFLGGEVGLLRLKQDFLNGVEPVDHRRYPAPPDAAMYSRPEGLSAASRADQDYASIANLVANNVRMADFYSAYRRLHGRSGRTNRVRLGQENPVRLSLSPFKPRYFTNPWVFAPILVAGTAGYFGSSSDRPLSSASDVTMFDRTLSPSEALGTYAMVQAFRYTTVAVGEELFFRGALQTELIERTTPGFALGAAAVLFGAWHVPNNGWAGGLAGVAAGLYLGHRYQASGYDLGETVALHFWLDWLPTLIAFARDPRDAQFVYAIDWKP